MYRRTESMSTYLLSSKVKTTQARRFNNNDIYHSLLNLSANATS